MGRLQSTASAGDPLTLSEINTQFNATSQSLRAFLRGGTYVPNSDINGGLVTGPAVPTSGTIKMSDLLGKSEVFIGNHTVNSSGTGVSASASSTVRLRNDGTFTYTIQQSQGGGSTGSYTGEWLPGNKNPGDYSVNASWSGSGTGTFTGTTSTWVALSATQTWTLSTSGNAAASGTLTLTIRNTSDTVVLDTAVITLNSESNNLA